PAAPRISTRQQADFTRRFYAGALPVSAAATGQMQSIMPTETRGEASVSGRPAGCESTADGSRSVGRWAGRLKSPDRDLIIAASIENDQHLPGREVESR